MKQKLTREDRRRLNQKLLTNNIHKLLAARNMSQTDLAKKLKVEREYVNRLANDFTKPNIVKALEIAEALNVQVEEVFELVREKS
jgi:transcriptional regulator with XRE-family HTH domain